MDVVFSLLDGSPITDIPEEVYYIPDSEKVIADCPDVALWRLSYDLEAEEVVVRYEGMSEAEAEAQHRIDVDAEVQAAQDALESES